MISFCHISFFQHFNHIPLVSPSFWKAMGVALCVQGSANVQNTLGDFAKGVDNSQTSGDRILVDGTITKVHTVS